MALALKRLIGRLVDRALAARGPPRTAPRAAAEPLEPRILYSADPFGASSAWLGAADVVVLERGNVTSPASAASRDESTGQAVAESAVVHPAASLESRPADADETGPSTRRREVIILDPGVQNWELLRDLLLAQPDAGRDLQLFVLDGQRDGVEQVGQILAQFRDLDAVHLLSHGTADGLQLGSTWLDGRSMLGHSEAIRSWQRAFGADGDLLLYGCDLAATDAGRSLVHSLAEWTGADVAASTDLTGHTLLGGDWDLEYRTGQLETRLVAESQQQSLWFGLMAVSVNSTSSAATAGSASSLTWSHTLVAGGSRALIVSLSLTAGQATSVTYGGTALTLVGRYTGMHGHTGEFWRLMDASLVTGAANVVATFTGSTEAIGGAVAFDGVDQATPTGAVQGQSTDSGTASVTVASAAGELVIDTLFVDFSTTAAAAGPQVERWELTNGRTGAGSTAAGAASVTMSWSLGGADEWNLAAVAIKPSSNQPPVLTTTGTVLGYTENAAATAIDPGLTVSDADSANLTGATVSVSANYVNGQDVLAFTNQAGITGSWNAASGVLTLSGTATVANYQSALRSVSYVNTSDSPSTATRTVSFTVSDGAANGSASRNVSVTALNDAPVLGYTGSIGLPLTDEDTTSASTLVSAILTSASMSDVDAGAQRGIAVTSVSANGTFQYSTDGVTWTDFGAVGASNALLLATTIAGALCPGRRQRRIRQFRLPRLGPDQRHGVRERRAVVCRAGRWRRHDGVQRTERHGGADRHVGQRCTGHAGRDARIDERGRHEDLAGVDLHQRVATDHRRRHRRR